MDDPDDLTAPQPILADTTHAVVKAAIASLPIVGGGAAELIDRWIQPPLAERRQEWLERVVTRLLALEATVAGFSVEDAFQKNPAFVTAFLHASQVAQRTHQEEKLEALRNAILNSALPNAPDEDLQLMFLEFIDTFTQWHIRILTYFQNPRQYGESRGITYPDWYMGGASTVLEHTFPELSNQKPFYTQIVRDLYARGLMSIESLNTVSTGHGMFGAYTTDFGRKLIRFITAPDQAETT